MFLLKRRKCRAFLLLLLLMAAGLTNAAQARQKNKDKEKPAPPKQTHRTELLSDAYEEDHWVQALPDSALLLVTSKSDHWFGKNSLVFTKYDRQLKQVWQSKVEHKPYHELYKVATERANIFLLYTTSSAKKLLLYRVNPTSGEVTSSEHVLPTSSISINEMAALDGQVFLSGVERSNLNMLHLDPSQEDIKQLPDVFGMEEDLGEFRVDTLDKAVEFVVAESNGWRSRVQTKRMNPKGEVMGTYFLQPETGFRNDITLQGARLTPGDTLSKLLIGTYGHRTSIFSKGLFTSNLSGELKYHDFGKLDHFFDYLTPRGQRKMKARLKRQEEKEKPLVLRYRLLLHPVLPHPQGYAIVGEIYYPQYRSQGNNYNYNPGVGISPDLRYNRSNFDGYRFSHAITCVFDKEGNLLWDSFYNLQNETFKDLSPTVEAGVLPDGRVAMIYPEKEFLWYKTLGPNKTLSDEEKMSIEPPHESEKIVTSTHEGIIHWYGGNFVAFGFQRIKPENGQVRKVFYLQNLLFE